MREYRVYILRKPAYYLCNGVFAVLRRFTRSYNRKTRLARYVEITFIVQHYGRIDFALRELLGKQRIRARHVLYVVGFEIAFGSLYVIDASCAL